MRIVSALFIVLSLCLAGCGSSKQVVADGVQSTPETHTCKNGQCRRQ